MTEFHIIVGEKTVLKMFIDLILYLFYNKNKIKQ